MKIITTIIAVLLVIKCNSSKEYRDYFFIGLEKGYHESPRTGIKILSTDSAIKCIETGYMTKKYDYYKYKIPENTYDSIYKYFIQNKEQDRNNIFRCADGCKYQFILTHKNNEIFNKEVISCDDTVKELKSVLKFIYRANENFRNKKYQKVKYEYFPKGLLTK